MPAAQLTSGTTSSSSATNRYSLFNDLDNIALSPPSLALASASLTPARVDDDTIRRLSDSLQNLVSQQHGLNHLPESPELPIPTYDNGNVDLNTLPSRPQSSPLAANFHPSIVVSKPAARPNLPRNISDISSDLDDAVDPRFFSHSSHLLAHIDSPLPSYNGSIHREHIVRRNGSTRASRPISMYSTSTAPRVPSRTRPDTSDSQSSPSRQHKKTISYSDQRYSPTRQQESTCPQHLLPQQSVPKNQAQRRFRLIPSFKNLHAQAKIQAKRLTVEERPNVHEKPKHDSANLIDIHAALRDGLSPLHDPDHVQKFTLECQEMLDPRPDSRQRRNWKKLLPQSGVAGHEINATATNIMPPVYRHTSNTSEVPTVDTNILNWDWPQPPATHLAVLSEGAQPQDATASVLRTGLISHNEDHKYTTAPSPPPSYPLPPVPSAAGALSKQSSKRSFVNPVTSANLGLSFKKYTTPNKNTSCSKTNIRIKALAASRGLSLDAGLHQDGSNACEMAGKQAGDPLPSPLNARFNQSSRNSKVRELKKRHLSLLVRDMPVFTQDNYQPQERAVPGPGSSEVPTSAYASTRMPIPKKLSQVDQRKPLPLTPVSARYSGSGEGPAAVTKANIGKSRHVRTESTKFRHSSHQVHGADQLGPLAHSGVMVVVDSSPRISRDFRAGAIRVPGTHRRKASINRAQILQPLRYQPSQKKKVQPRRSLTLPGDEQSSSDASSEVSNTRTGLNQMSDDLEMAFATQQTNSGMVSPSKASSILEPSPFHPASSRRDSGQCLALSERDPTPVRYVKDKQYVPMRDGTSVPSSPPAGQGRSFSACSASRRTNIEHLHNEINRMVSAQQGPEIRKGLGPRSKLLPADKLKSERESKARVRSSSKTSPYNMTTASDILAQIEADLVKTTSTVGPSLPSSRRTTKSHSSREHDDSDMSLTPKSSFQSTSSGSSNKQTRKNSDASMTDPNDYEIAPCPSKESRGLALLPTPPKQRPVDATSTRSKKRYSNMSAWTTTTSHGRVTSSNESIGTSRETPYTFRKQEHGGHFPQRQIITNNNDGTIIPDHHASLSNSNIELNHFLTEADQMDNAIDSFIQFTSTSTSTPSNKSTRSRSRSKLPVPITPTRTSSASTIAQRPMNMTTHVQLRTVLQAQRYQEFSENRHSAVSNCSNIVDLQRIQDQVNGVVHDHGPCREVRAGTVGRDEAFGRITLVARPA